MGTQGAESKVSLVLHTHFRKRSKLFTVRGKYNNVLSGASQWLGKLGPFNSKNIVRPYKKRFSSYIFFVYEQSIIINIQC